MATKQKRFDALVNALYADVYRYAFWLSHNPAVAEDLVQDTYLRAWKHFENLKDEKSARAWLFTIVRRENARRFERIQPDMIELDEIMIEDTSVTPGEYSEQHMMQRHIASLDLEFREPLLLQLIGGFSTEEIAGILELNKNTVLTRLFRARNKLRQLISQPQSKGVSNG